MKRNYVWSSEEGDVRKKSKKNNNKEQEVNISDLKLSIRRLTAGKGRTVIELTGLPENKSFNKDLSRDLKKGLGVTGTFKENKIEIHGEVLDRVCEILNKKEIKWKKIGG